MGGSSNKDYLSGSNSSQAGGKPPSHPSKGGGGGAGGGSGGGSDSCNIIASGTLRSPDPTVVPTLSVGQVLAVDAVAVAGVGVLRARNGAGVQVGVIDTPEEQALLDCIATGNVYQAEIRRIAGGAISVRITRV